MPGDPSYIQRKPVSYALLQLPPRSAMRRMRVTEAPLSPCRDNIYTRWTTHPFATNVERKEEAIDIVNEVCANNDRIVKVRIVFSDGSHLIFSRDDPKDIVFKRSTVFDPQEAFSKETARKTQALRPLIEKKLKYLVDDNGHPLKRNPNALSHYNPAKLFAAAPVPTASSFDFSFTPVSHMSSFSVRPHYKIPGCRPGIGDFSEKAIHFRPRHYNTRKFLNTEEVDARNTIKKERLARAGDGVYSGLFLRTTSAKKGGATVDFTPTVSKAGEPPSGCRYRVRLTPGRPRVSRGVEVPEGTLTESCGVQVPSVADDDHGAAEVDHSEQPTNGGSAPTQSKS